MFVLRNGSGNRHVNPAAQPREASRPAIKREVKELLAALPRSARTLDRTMDIRDAVQPVLNAMARHMGMARCTLTLLDRGTGEIHIEGRARADGQPAQTGHLSARRRGDRQGGRDRSARRSCRAFRRSRCS